MREKIISNKEWSHRPVKFKPEKHDLRRFGIIDIEIMKNPERRVFWMDSGSGLDPAIIDIEIMKNPERRVFWMDSGFGIDPAGYGKAVYGFQVINGIRVRQEKYNITRIATEEEIMSARQYYLQSSKEVVFDDSTFDQMLEQHRNYIKLRT